MPFRGRAPDLNVPGTRPVPAQLGCRVQSSHPIGRDQLASKKGIEATHALRFLKHNSKIKYYVPLAGI